jgi:hypothetical protein
LDAAIEARVELGTPPEQAEREAVEAFGKPKALIQRLSDVHRPKRAMVDGPFTAVAVVCTAFQLWMMSARSLPNYVLLVWLAMLVVFLIQSWRVRRLQILVFSALLVPLLCVVTVAQSFTYVTLPLEPPDRAERANLRALEVESLKNLERNRRFLAQIEEGYQRYVAGEPIAPGRTGFGSGDAPNFHTITDLEAAGERWARALPAMRRLIGTTQADQSKRIELVRLARSQPWWFQIPGEVLPAAAVVFGVSLYWFIPHALAVLTRWLASQIGGGLRPRHRGRPA